MTDLTNTPEPALGLAGNPDAGTRGQLTAQFRGRHYSTVQLVRYFAYSHLADRLRDVAAQYAALAVNLVEGLPDGPELTVALRKLVESKDAAVRHLVDVLSED